MNLIFVGFWFSMFLEIAIFVIFLWKPAAASTKPWLLHRCWFLINRSTNWRKKTHGLSKNSFTKRLVPQNVYIPNTVRDWFIIMVMGKNYHGYDSYEPFPYISPNFFELNHWGLQLLQQIPQRAGYRLLIYSWNLACLCIFSLSYFHWLSVV